MNDTTQNLEHKNICNKKSLDAEITYQVNGTSFVVQPIFKEKSFETLGSVFITAYDIKRIKFLKQADRRLKARYNINVKLSI